MYELRNAVDSTFAYVISETRAETGTCEENRRDAGLGEGIGRRNYSIYRYSDN